jgi:hypothetical protein
VSTLGFLAFAGGGAAFLMLLHRFGARGDALRAAGEPSLPAQWLLALGDTVRSLQGIGIGIGAIVLLSLPFLMGARGRTAMKTYAALGLCSVAANAAFWWFLLRAAESLQINAAPR